ncbi:ATP-binding protein [Streptomyces sp. NPDC090032]|uniref:ATP-binding protein n=1 Tax=Streptomyces sp. NPDC090032 TaxID=3365925 RepID=UPI0037F41838
MNQESTTATGELLTPRELARPVRHFSTRFPATRRGAHAARHLAERELAAWEGVPEEIAESAVLVVAELAANAALHGRVSGRGARPTLALATDGVLRVEVTDARGERAPAPPPVQGGESGRGLLLVAALADRWGWTPYPPSGKSVWAEFDLRRAR